MEAQKLRLKETSRRSAFRKQSFYKLPLALLGKWSLFPFLLEMKNFEIFFLINIFNWFSWKKLTKVFPKNKKKTHPKKRLKVKRFSILFRPTMYFFDLVLSLLRRLSYFSFLIICISVLVFSIALNSFFFTQHNSSSQNEDKTF